MIGKDVETGSYDSVEDFVECAVRLLHEQEEWLAANNADKAAQVEHGYVHAELGELLENDEVIRILLQRHEMAHRE